MTRTIEKWAEVSEATRKAVGADAMSCARYLKKRLVEAVERVGDDPAAVRAEFTRQDEERKAAHAQLQKEMVVEQQAWLDQQGITDVDPNEVSRCDHCKQFFLSGDDAIFCSRGDYCDACALAGHANVICNACGQAVLPDEIESVTAEEGVHDLCLDCLTQMQGVDDE